MRAMEELVRRKLEKRAPDKLSPKPDPYELRAPQGCSPYSNANGGQSIRANFVVTNPTGGKLQRRLIVKHGF